MLGLVSHPFACAIYFFALQIAIIRSLGPLRSTSGFAGRTALFVLAILAVFSGALMVGEYAVAGSDPETNLGLFLTIAVVIAPVPVIVAGCLGTLVAALTKRHLLVYELMTATMIGWLFFVLLRLHGIL